MKECDIFRGVITYSDSSDIYSGRQDPQIPDLRPPARTISMLFRNNGLLNDTVVSTAAHSMVLSFQAVHETSTKPATHSQMLSNPAIDRTACVLTPLLNDDTKCRQMVLSINTISQSMLLFQEQDHNTEIDRDTERDRGNC